MNKQYRFCLQAFGKKDKIVIVSTYDSIRAREMIKENYPEYEISQFWVVWP